MKKNLPYIIAIATFIIVSLAYFHPVLQGKVIEQSDIVQFKGSSKELNDYRNETGNEAYWTNTSFSGMPAYNVSANYPYNFIGKIDKILRFLPRPADYLFLYFLGFFVLLQVLKIDWKIAIIGSLGFGFSTYLIVILGVGHNAKAHAIAYFPLILAGIIRVFDKKYLSGFILTALAMAFEINAGHPQMTYYLLFMVLILGVFYLLEAFKEKTTKHFFKSVSILLFAVVLGAGMNATNLLATKSYKKDSTRSESELTILPNGKKKKTISTGLDTDYITEYSYGKLETFNLFISRFMGGASNEKLTKNSNTYKFIAKDYGKKQAANFVENGVPTYWGKQPYVAAPAYIGAIFIFLFVLGIFIVKNKYKKWLVATSIFALLLSFGKNLPFLTNFFIEYVPLYNIFRSVSSIQVLIELAIPLLGIMALAKMFSLEISKENKIKYLKLSVYIVGGLALFFGLVGTFLFNFEGQSDRSLDQMITGFSDAVIADRKSMFRMDSFRSLALILGVAAAIWFYVKQKISANISFIIIGILIVLDLVLVDKRYVNASNFVDKINMEKPFLANKIDKEILKDKSHFRVLNLAGNPMNEARTSYFHNSLGGYHAAKPRRYQELFEYQIAKMNEETLNMLNTKYIVFNDKEGNITYEKNTKTNGNAWFVQKIYVAQTADEEIKFLDTLQTKKAAILSKITIPKIDKYTLPKQNYEKDSTAIIKLTDKNITKFTYQSFSNKDQFAVFSETYFKDWKATIDGKQVPIYRVNYVLRGLEIPKGKHTIVFTFVPNVIKTGNSIVLGSYIFLLLISVSWWYFWNKKN